MARLPIVYAALQVLSAIFLVVGFVLAIVVNSAKLATFSLFLPEGNNPQQENLNTTTYYLWYMTFSLFGSLHWDYSPGSVIACRALDIIALVLTGISLCAIVYGIVRHWWQMHGLITKALLYVALILSCIAFMVLIGFIITFNSYFNDTNALNEYDSGSVGTGFSHSWKEGMHCAVAATVMCFLSAILDCVLLYLTTKMGEEQQAGPMPENAQQQPQPYGQQWGQPPPQADPADGQQWGQPPPQADPAYGQQWGQPPPQTYGMPMSQQPPQPDPGYGEGNTYYSKTD